MNIFFMASLILAMLALPVVIISPARPLWPDPKRWPARWNVALAETVREGIVRLAERLLRATSG